MQLIFTSESCDYNVLAKFALLLVAIVIFALNSHQATQYAINAINEHVRLALLPSYQEINL